MIESIELKTLADFEGLKKGNCVAVEWRRNVPTSKRSEKTTRFAVYTVVDNLTRNTEIILEKPMNIYFNYMMFLDPETHGVSNARHVTLLRSAQ